MAAEVLFKLNQSLTTESTKLLSLVRVSMAEDAVRPLFFNAYKEYQPYQQVVENISLASKLTNKDLHAKWYKDWAKLENSVLAPGEDFAKYPQNSRKRVEQLNSFLQVNLMSLNSVKDKVLNEDKLKQISPKINEIVEKLKRDKSLLI